MQQLKRKGAKDLASATPCLAKATQSTAQRGIIITDHAYTIDAPRHVWAQLKQIISKRRELLDEEEGRTKEEKSHRLIIWKGMHA
jgi:hypothetical protein